MTQVVDLLERPLYSAGQAARLLRVGSGQTVMRWVDGYRRRGVEYPPVIREQSTGSDVITWGEFVEARYLAQLRADGASLQRLRKVITTLKRRFDTAYPLAHLRPFMDGREVVLQAQADHDLPRGVRLVEETDGQTRLSLASEEHVARIRWADDIAQTLHPAGETSPVVIDPVRGFGMPSLEGRNLRTEIIAELFEAGDNPEDIAEAYDLRPAQVLAALRWELGRAAG